MNFSIRRYSNSYFSRVHAEEFIPLNFIEKSLLFLYSSIGALNDPKKGYLVACLGEMMSSGALANIYDQMRSDQIGREILMKKPFIDDKHIDFEALKSLPDNTLGKTYINFMETYKYHAREREPVHFVEDEELAYVMTRYRQLHDFAHVLFGLNTTVECEVALKAIEMVQTKLPMTCLAALCGPFATPILRIKSKEFNTPNKHCSNVNDPVHYELLESFASSAQNYSASSTQSKQNEADDFHQCVLYPRRILLTELLPWDDLRKYCGISTPPEHLRCYTEIKPNLFT